MRWVPLLGLLLASPVVAQALTGQRDTVDAFGYWLGAMVVAFVGVRLWELATTPSPQRVAQQAQARRGSTPRRRRTDQG